MPLHNGFPIDAVVWDALPGATAQPLRDVPRFDAPGFVPHDAQQPRGALHRAFPEQVYGQPLEPHGELTARLRPGHRDLLDSVDRTAHAEEVCLNPRRKLTGIQMPPLSVLAIIARDRLLTLRAGMEPCSSLDGYGHLLPCHIQLHVDYGPGGVEPQHRLIQFEVAHRSSPSCEGPSIAQAKSVPHTISR